MEKPKAWIQSFDPLMVVPTTMVAISRPRPTTP